MKTFTMFGDSTTVGTILVSPPSNYSTSIHSTFNTANDLLGHNYATQFQLNNEGVGGSTAANWCNGGTIGNVVMPSMAARMQTPLAQSTDVFIFEIGINDSFVAGINVNDFNWCLNEIHRLICTVAGKQLIFATPNPISDSAHNGILWNLQHNMVYMAGIMGVPVLNYWDGIVNCLPNYPDLLPDGIHPGHTLYAFKGAMLAARLQGYLK